MTHCLSTIPTSMKAKCKTLGACVAWQVLVCKIGGPTVVSITHVNQCINTVARTVNSLECKLITSRIHNSILQLFQPQNDHRKAT